MAGCSKSYDPAGDITVKWDGATLSYGGTDLTSVTEYTGDTAVATLADGTQASIMLSQSDTLEVESHNYQMVEQVNMDQIGGCYMFTAYLNTELHAYYPVAESYWNYGEVFGEIDKNLHGKYLADVLKATPLVWGMVNVDCGDLTFSFPAGTCRVTPTFISSKSVIKLSKGTKEECTTPMTIMQGDKEVLLNSYSDANFTWYQYNDWVIQTANGINVGDYITFDL